MVSFVNNRTKMIIGGLAIILSIIFFIITPNYIEFYLILIFLIPGIILIIGNDAVKNSKPIGIITLVFVAVAAYFAINGIMYTYDIVTNLYVTGQLSTTPTASDINACFNGYLMVLINALFNLITAALFFIPTTSKTDEDEF